MVPTAPIVLAALLSSTQMPATTKRIAFVVTVVRPEADQAPTDVSIFASATAAAGYFLDVEVVTPGEMSQGLDEQLRTCRADLSCLAARLDHQEVDLGLMVVINTELSPPLVTGELIDARARSKIADVLIEVPSGPTEAAVSREVQRLLASRGHRLGGRLVVAPSPGEALAQIEGGATAPVGGVPNTFTLRPGEYIVLVASPGFADERRTVTVTAGDTTELSVQLRKETSLWASPWLWVAVAGVVAGGVGLGLGLGLREPGGPPVAVYDGTMQ